MVGMKLRFKTWLRQFLIDVLFHGDEKNLTPPLSNSFDVRIEFAWKVHEPALVDYIQNALRQNWGDGARSVKVIRRR
jgi:hypothetical protein